MWKSFFGELREIVWLTSAVAGLSILGVAIAVAIAIV